MNNKPAQSKHDRFGIRRNRGGFALATMLCAVVILFILGGALLSVGMHSQVLSVRTSSEIAARCAADAGLTKALYEMNEKLKVIPWSESDTPTVIDEELPNTNATYSYSVTGDLDSGYFIQSTGKSGVREKIIRCSLSLQGPFERAILAQEDVILKAWTLVDGYNSGDPWDTDVVVQVGTTSILPDSIILKHGVVINGNVVVGVGGDVDTVIRDMGATTGRRYALNKWIEMPPVYPPELTDKGSGIKVHGKTLTIGPSDNGKYGEIELKKASNPGILEVNGGDVVLYVTGDISLGQSCEIVIKDGSSLALYLDGNMEAGNDAGINNESVPSSLKIFGTSTEEQHLTLKAKGETLGAIYAPNAVVIIMAHNDIYGSVTAKSFEMKAGGNFYYDKALKYVTTDDDAVRFVITQWQEE